jgi:hypothetical protein
MASSLLSDSVGISAADAECRKALLAYFDGIGMEVDNALSSADSCMIKARMNPTQYTHKTSTVMSKLIATYARAFLPPPLVQEPEETDDEPTQEACRMAPPGDLFSHLVVDNTISRFGPEETRALRMIYEAVCYTECPNPCRDRPGDAPVFYDGTDVLYGDGHKGSLFGDDTIGPFFVVREFNLRPPDDPDKYRHIIMSGAPQLSKTQQIVAAAWCCAFIAGCQPVIAVRNAGGKNTGAVDMIAGVHNFNAIIRAIFRKLISTGTLGQPAKINLPISCVNNFVLAPVNGAEGNTIEFDDEGYLTSPQVLIMLSNPTQLHHLMFTSHPSSNAPTSLVDIFKGGTEKFPSRYPAKLHSPDQPADLGMNRLTAAMVLLADESDQNFTQRPGALSECLFRVPKGKSATNKRKSVPGLQTLQHGLEVIVPQDEIIDNLESDREITQRQQQDMRILDDDFAMDLNEETDSETDYDEDSPNEIMDAAQIIDSLRKDVFHKQCRVQGLFSAVRVVVSITATPIACVYDLPKGYSQGAHQIIQLTPPKNYVSLPVFAHPDCVQHVQVVYVSGRGDIKKATKSQLYDIALRDAGLYDYALERRLFIIRSGQIRVRNKRDLMDSREDKLIRILKNVEIASKTHTSVTGVVQWDMPAIRQMLQAMNVDPTEPERRGLIMSNLTKTMSQKVQLVARLLCKTGNDSVFQYTNDLFIIVFDHRLIDITWRHDANVDPEDFFLASSGVDTHMTLLGSDDKTHRMRLLPPNINKLYSVLISVAETKRVIDPEFKLKSLVLTGDIGGRGLNYKAFKTHQGYLTDFLMMFDVPRNRQMTAHGEAMIQWLGRLFGLVNRSMLKQMLKTPPRLFTSEKCWACLDAWGGMLSQYMGAVSDRHETETLPEALSRRVAEDPHGNQELHKCMTRSVTDSTSSKPGFLCLTRIHQADDRTRKATALNLRRGLTPIAPTHRLGVPTSSDSHLRQLLVMADADNETDPAPAYALTPVMATGMKSIVQRMQSVDLVTTTISSEGTRHNYILFIQQLHRLKILSTMDDFHTLTTREALMNHPQFPALLTKKIINSQHLARDRVAAIKFVISIM